MAALSDVLYVEIDRFRHAGHPLRRAVPEGSPRQMRPCPILIVVAMLAMVPAAAATGVGSDLQRPLATVDFGGLVPTSLLTLFAWPSLHALLRGVGGREARPDSDSTQ
jgi:cobalt-zinc-cadmium resistance protein CzcA